MSDTSSIICLDDILEDELPEPNRPPESLPSEQLWAVVDYVKFDNSTDKVELPPTKEPPDVTATPILNNVSNNLDVSCNGEKIYDRVKENTEIVSVCLDDSDEDDDKKLMEIDAQYTTTCFLTPLYEVENSNVICKEDSNRKYECKKCEKFFFSRKALLTHYKEHYREEREERIKNRINCPVCKQYFNSAKDFVWHEPECKGRFQAKQSNRNARKRMTRSQNSI